MDPVDIVSIHQLLARYGHVADMPPSNLRNELRKEVFSPDGVLDMTALGLGRLEGLEAMGGFSQASQERQAGAHHMSNVYVYEQDGETCAHSKFFVPVGERWCGGDYHDVLIKGPDGWRIRERVLKPLWGDWPEPVGILPRSD